MKQRKIDRAEKLMKRLLEDQGVNVSEAGAFFDREDWKHRQSLEKAISNAYYAIGDLINEIDDFEVEEKLEAIMESILGPHVR